MMQANNNVQNNNEDIEKVQKGNQQRSGENTFKLKIMIIFYNIFTFKDFF